MTQSLVLPLRLVFIGFVDGANVALGDFECTSLIFTVVVAMAVVVLGDEVELAKAVAVPMAAVFTSTVVATAAAFVLVVVVVGVIT